MVVVFKNSECFIKTASFVDLFVICVCLKVCHTVMSVSCSLMVTCWESADLLALLFVLFSLCYCHLPI